MFLLLTAVRIDFEFTWLLLKGKNAICVLNYKLYSKRQLQKSGFPAKCVLINYKLVCKNQIKEIVE